MKAIRRRPDRSRPGSAASAAAIVAAVVVAATVAGSVQAAQAVPAAVQVPCSAAALASAMTGASSGDTLSLARRCTYDRAGLPVVHHDLTIAGNEAILPGSGLTVDSGTLAVSNLNFRQSGILVTLAGNLTVHGGTFSGGMSTFGGAIDVNAPGAGALSVTGATFTGNTAADAGGAIYDYSYVDAYITDCTFTGNHAGGLGGAILADPDSATHLLDVVVRGNSATTGGGIFNATDIDISASQISGNHAAGRGGGLYTSSNSGSGPPDAQVTGTVFRGNSAQQGAGIYSEGGLASITASAITGNNAAGSGGGIYSNGGLNLPSGPVNLTDSKIARNSAGASGGGIYNQGRAAVAVATTTITGNMAATGGGIYDNGPFAIVTLTASPVLGNRPDNCEPASSITGCSR